MKYQTSAKFDKAHCRSCDFRYESKSHQRLCGDRPKSVFYLATLGVGWAREEAARLRRVARKKAAA